VGSPSIPIAGIASTANGDAISGDVLAVIQVWAELKAAAADFASDHEFRSLPHARNATTPLLRGVVDPVVLYKIAPMNLELLKRNVGHRVQLGPPAIHLAILGRELPGYNEDWIIESVSDTEIGLSDTQMGGLSTTLGKDYVHHWTSNPSRSVAGGLQYGFLTLTVQMFIQDDKISYMPCSRPGERVNPLSAPVAELYVDLRYAQTSGIEARLNAEGYRGAWVRASLLPGLEFEGWETVVANDRHGMPTSFHVRTRPENMVYVKKRLE
jgi:hypothetical protein